ncbi:MAG: hypothetical protein KDA50_09455 [Rhodobacteraceae bacterium]|nr:hypothetical protein [Paracoccaceae bacterium]
MRMDFLPSLVVAALIIGTAAEAQDTSDWQFQITPYAWLSGLEGDVGAIPGVPSGSVDLSFGDILDDLDFAGMVMASARNGPWVIYLDTAYVRTSSTEKLGGRVFDRVDVESETANLALSVGRAFAETPGGSVDVYVGARAWWMENRFDLHGVRGGRSKRTEDANWIDPLIGISARTQVADRWILFGALEAGGFGVGSDNAWSALAGATYQVTDRFGATFGWRHLAVDYNSNGVLFDVHQAGPVLGATFKF